MFGKEPKNKTKLTREVGKLLDELNEYSPDSPEWDPLMEKLERLTALQARDKKSIDPNTIALVAGNLLGILVIVAYEQKHVFTSKGLSQLLKTK